MPASGVISPSRIPLRPEAAADGAGSGSSAIRTSPPRTRRRSCSARASAPRISGLARALGEGKSARPDRGGRSDQGEHRGAARSASVTGEIKAASAGEDGSSRGSPQQERFCGRVKGAPHHRARARIMCVSNAQTGWSRSFAATAPIRGASTFASGSRAASDGSKRWATSGDALPRSSARQLGVHLRQCRSQPTEAEPPGGSGLIKAGAETGGLVQPACSQNALESLNPGYAELLFPPALLAPPSSNSCQYL